MNPYTSRLVSMAVVLACGLAPEIAAAQGRGRDGAQQSGEPRGGGRSADGRGARPESRAVPRQRREAPPQQSNPSRQDRREAPNGGGRYNPPQRYGPPPRYTPTERYAPAPRYSPPAGRYVPAPRYVYTPRYTMRYYANRPIYRPYYSFVPRFHLGFGIYIGNSVPFPSWYEPYGPGTYGYYRSGASYGGVSFDIEPYDASIFVDGEYVGVADEFSPIRAPLTLRAGRHRIDIDAPGWAPLSFDITVVPRQVIPYSGSLGR